MLHFVTFASTNKYSTSFDRIAKEAADLGIFENIWVWNENDLDISFRTKHNEFLQTSAKGYGYWIWKPQVILQALKKIPEGDILIYADIGCSFNKNGILRIFEYESLARESSCGIMGFQLTQLEKKFNKMSTVYEVFGEKNEKILNTLQLLATCVVIHNVEAAVNFVQEWADLCVRNQYMYVDDSPSILPNLPEFEDHRHDQSIFSLLAKKYDMTTIPDETWDWDWWDKYNFPIYASRFRQ